MKLIELALIALFACRLVTGRWPWQIGRTKHRPSGQQGAPTTTSAAELAQARALLGLGADAERQAILDAHRRLMLSVHPDRGGSNASARAANAARDLLLGQCDADTR